MRSRPALLVALACAVALLTLLCFLPALDAGFVNFDDDRTVTANNQLRFDGPALAWMFSTVHMGHYQPLAWLSLALDRALWGSEPFGFHLTSVLLHALAAVLCFFVARRLLRAALASPGTADPPGAADPALELAAGVAALAFAIHPLRVESVAWVTERRDVLAGCLYLAALLAWLAGVERAARRTPAGARRGASVGMGSVALLQLLSLLAKAWAVSLPLVLLVLDRWPLRRREPVSALLREKLPLLALSAVFLLLAGHAQQEAGIARGWNQHGLLARTLQAAWGLCFYPFKTLLPHDLVPLVPLGAVLDVREARWWLALAAVLVLTVGLLLARRRAPALLASWLIYGLIIAPVLGFWQSGPQLAADRYSYLACLPFALLAGGGALLIARRSAAPARTAGACGLLLVVLLAPLTWAQSRLWHDSIALWSATVEVEPDSYFARHNLGKALLDAGRAEEAVPHLQVALAQLPPDRAGRLAVLQTSAAALATSGRFEAAFPLWEEVLRLDPEHVDVLVDVANAHSLRGEHETALAWYERAVQTCARRTAATAAAHGGVAVAEDGALQRSCTRAQVLLDEERARR